MTKSPTALHSSAPNPSIVWFKRDLRVADRSPLLAAAQRGPAIPLYVVEPKMWA